MARLIVSLPAPLRRPWWLLLIVGVVMAFGSWFAYEDIPSVHFHLLVAWARAYDTVSPHGDSLPTPANVIAVMPTFSLSTPPVIATPHPGSLADLVSATTSPNAPTVMVPTSVSPTPMPTPLPDYVLLQGVRHEQQYFNNCGPTTLAMALSYWGWQGDQHTIQPYLRPNKDDKNVSPDEMAAYLAPHGFDSVVRVNGDVDTLRRFIAAGYPVIVEKGMLC